MGRAPAVGGVGMRRDGRRRCAKLVLELGAVGKLALRGWSLAPPRAPRAHHVRGGHSASATKLKRPRLASEPFSAAFSALLTQTPRAHLRGSAARYELGDAAAPSCPPVTCVTAVIVDNLTHSSHRHDPQFLLTLPIRLSKQLSIYRWAYSG